jgi:hypothetical protein
MAKLATFPEVCCPLTGAFIGSVNLCFLGVLFHATIALGYFSWDLARLDDKSLNKIL